MRTSVVLCALFSFASASGAGAQVFSQSWGSYGTATGQFYSPTGIATDVNGFVYVTDEVNDRVQKFDSDGNFVVAWGGHGTGDGQFNDPTGLTVDYYGRVYVADRGNHRIQKFVQQTSCPAGTTQVAAGVCFERTWGTFGASVGQFISPFTIAVEPPDANGNISYVYVADTNNNRIQKFTLSGTFVLSWGTLGSGNGQFNDPRGIALDKDRNVYVSERINNRIQKFTQYGTYVRQWGSTGTGNGQFDGPDGLDVDPIGNIYVSDEFNCRIQKFTRDGTFVAAFGHLGTGSDELRFMMDLAVDRNDPFGKIYIADSANNRIQVLSYPDTDGDGLLDVWETNGIDIDGDGIVDLDLPALGASPTHKDVFLELDYMQYHDPSPQSMNAIVSAYANAPVSNPDGTTGINLHLDVDDQIPHQPALYWTDYDALKATYFGSAAQRASANAANTRLAKQMVYHYVLFAHANSGMGGSAEAPGNDIFMFKGGSDGTSPPDPDDEAGGLMHELGHNLGLHHGGGDQINCKPNYLSLMNYAWNWNWIKHFIPGYSRPLDYSREVNPTLDESNLSEPAGVVTTSTSWLYTYYGHDPSVPALIGPVNAPIDWNRDGDALDTGVTADINLASVCPGDGTILQGFNDWLMLHYNFRNTLAFAENARPNDSEHPPGGDPTSDQVVQAILASTLMSVRIDVNPLDPTNTIDVRANTIVLVAIVTNTFDATAVDPATVTFGPNQAHALYSAAVDVDSDGDKDLVLVFKTRDTGLACGQTTATLTGKTFGGGTIRGTDHISPRPCR